MMKRILLILMVMSTFPLLAQVGSVTGTVIDTDSNPLPGVNVLVQGTTTGTQTDFDGNYTIEAANGAVLRFTYIGLKPMDMTVGSNSVIDVIMEEDAAQLSEVVVTALGLKRQKKSLTYATQNIEIASIAEARPEQNLVNSLQGKVAGLSIQRSGNGVNGASKVVLRGNRSIAGSSQALYVVDGVPLGSDISNLAPDDIASINVLKGANAAALYGARANNGAIIVTTKSGVEGKTTINYSNTVTTEIANVLIDYQNLYGQGNGGNFIPSSTFSWGPRLGSIGNVANWSPSPEINGQLPYEAQPNNVRDFFQTGLNIANSLSIGSGGENTRTYFNYTHENRKGIVPGNELSRHNVSVKIDNDMLNDKLKLSTRINYIRSDTDNQLSTGEVYDNPLRHAYRIPRNVRLQDLQTFEYVDPTSGAVRQNYFKPEDNGGANPYWTINKNPNRIENNRILGYTSLTYEFTPNLSLLVRTAIDQSSSFRVDTDANDTYILAPNGNYIKDDSKFTEWNSDFLLSYTKDINDDLAFNVNFGGNNRQNKSETTNSDNRGLNTANVFTTTNASQLLVTENFSQREIQSLYGFGQFSVKDAVFVDLVYRSDWSSTLPSENRRFDYYSAGVSAVVSDLVKMPDFLSFLKLRASYAEVGNDTDPFQIVRTATTQAGGFINTSNTLPNSELRPEQTNSIEFGADLRLFDNRLGLDFTYYKSNSIDQLFQQNVPFPSGVSNRFVNGGDIQNKGLEIILTANPIRTENFSWNITANFTRNVSEVLRINDNLEVLDFGGDFMRRFFLEVGEPWGNVYSRGFERNEQGQVLVDANGLPIKTAGFSVPIGNYNPDWLGGFSNSFRFKNIEISFLIDVREGGTVASFTESNLASDGALEQTLVGRENGLVFGRDVFPELDVVEANGTANTTVVNAEAFWNSIGGRNAPLGEAFVQGASNIRLREATIGYSFPNELLDRTFLRSAKISLVGRNLFFFSNDASFDPEITTNTDTNTDGFESFAPPSTRSIGFNLKLGL